MDHVKGSIKSKTIWAAVVLAALANVAPLLPAYLQLLGIDGHTTQIVGSSVALLMVVLRSFTTGSLADKVTQADPSQSNQEKSS